MSIDLISRKKTLRQHIRQSCKLLPPEVKAQQTQQIFQFFQSLPEIQQAKNVLAYVGIGHEIDTRLFLQYCLDTGKHLLLPKVINDCQLTLHPIQQLDTDLRAGFRGILEPADTIPALDVTDIDVIFVPGVAFSRLGRRLGQGGGYYDRLLPLYPNARTIGAALTVQLIDDIPVDSHDQQIDIVITPEQVFR